MKSVTGISILACTALTTVAVLHIDARAENARDEISLDTITVTTTKTEDKVIDALSGSSVVNDVELERFQPNRLSDVLNTVPGVNVQEDADDPSSVINVRGLQDFGRVNVMVEGARQNFQRSGHGGDGQVYLEPSLVKSADVTRGPVATVYGSGAIGGVVNFSLIDPSDFVLADETWALSQGVTFDTNREGILTTTTLAAQPIEQFGVIGSFSVRSDGNYSDGNGDTVPFTSKDVVAGLVKAKWQLSDESSVEFIYLKQDFDYTTGAIGTRRDTHTVDDTVVGRFRHVSSDNPLVDLSMSAYFTNTNTDQLRLDGALAGNERSFQIKTFGTDVFNTSRFATGDFEHELTYGADFFQDTVTTFDGGGNGDEFTPSGERVAYGAFIQNQISYADWMKLIVGLRYDGYNLESDDGSVDSEDDNLSPKVTLGITPVEGVQVYGTYAEGYRAPSVTETLIEGVHPGGFAFILLPNPDLVPETSQTLEAGVNLSFDGVIRDDDRFRAKANYFHNDLSNFIDSVFRSAAQGGAPPFGDFQYQNIADAELYGFEVEALYDFYDGFVQASYTNTTGNNKTDGTPLSTVYPHKFAGTVGLRFLDNSLVVGARWTALAAQNRVPTGTPASEAYDLFDVFATYEHNRYFSTAVTLKNITDEQYVPFRQTEGVPSPGFSALLSAQVKLGG